MAVAALAAAASAALCAIAGFSGGVPSWVSHLMALLLGAGVSAAWFQLRVARRLSDMERACVLLQYGDLSQTVPESGTPGMRRIASVINSVSADFQEVLLLFAHLLRSARNSAELLKLHVVGEGGGGDRMKAAEIVEDIQQMEEMIHDFKYFRVRVEDDVIVDTGISSRQSLTAARGDGATATSADGNHVATGDRPYREEGIRDERQTEGARRVSGVSRG